MPPPYKWALTILEGDGPFLQAEKAPHCPKCSIRASSGPIHEAEWSVMPAVRWLQKVTCSEEAGSSVSPKLLGGHFHQGAGMSSLRELQDYLRLQVAPTFIPVPWETLRIPKDVLPAQGWRGRCRDLGEARSVTLEAAPWQPASQQGAEGTWPAWSLRLLDSHWTSWVQWRGTG